MSNSKMVRLLDAVPRLARPLDQVERDIYSWAGGLGLGPVYVREQFLKMFEVVKSSREQSIEHKYRQLDFQLAHGTLTALEHRPVSGWEGYLEQWTLVRLEHRLAVYGKGEFTRLRELEKRLGGILLNDRAMPMVLVLPQPSGTYVQMGWESIVELDTSPFSPERRQAKVIREHLLPVEERTFYAPSA